MGLRQSPRKSLEQETDLNSWEPMGSGMEASCWPLVAFHAISCSWRRVIVRCGELQAADAAARTSCHPKNEPLSATRDVGEDPLQMNGVSTNSCFRQHLWEVGH